MVVVIRKSLGNLVDQIIGVCTHSIEDDYPTPYQTFDEAWDNLGQSYDYLRDKLGERRYTQLVDMTAQAKAHFLAGETRLGGRLMQDMEQLVKNKPPFAYPEELYRWPRTIG